MGPSNLSKHSNVKETPRKPQDLLLLIKTYVKHIGELDHSFIIGVNVKYHSHCIK